MEKAAFEQCYKRMGGMDQEEGGKWAFQAGNSDNGGHEYIVVNRWRVVGLLYPHGPAQCLHRVGTQYMFTGERKEGRGRRRKDWSRKIASSSMRKYSNASSVLEIDQVSLQLCCPTRLSLPGREGGMHPIQH